MVRHAVFVLCAHMCAYNIVSEKSYSALFCKQLVPISQKGHIHIPQCNTSGYDSNSGVLRFELQWQPNFPYFSLAPILKIIGNIHTIIPQSLMLLSKLHNSAIFCCKSAPLYQYIKGTHTIYFSISLHIINQKPMIHRTDFHCISTWVARSSR